MNPSLTKNIAELQNINNRRDFLKPNDDQSVLLEALVKRISSFKLGRKSDKRGNRTGWFLCTDQDALIESLKPSEDQKQFLGSMILKLRIMTALDEGPKARSLDLFCSEHLQPDFPPSHHLLGMLALYPEDTQENAHALYTAMVFGLVLPGSPEFEDLQIIIDSFAA